MSPVRYRGTGRTRRERPRRPFTVLDELSCYFDTDAEPANVHLEVRVGARLDQAVFRAAAIAALRSNPRASARRAAGTVLSRRYRWEFPAEFDVDPISFATFRGPAELAARRAEFIARSPSIDTSPPVRILLATGPGCAHLILNAHHATMDGLSCLEVLREIGRHYRAQAGTSAGSPLPHRAASPEDSPAPGRGAAAGNRLRVPTRPARIAPDGGGGQGCDLRLWLLPGVPVVPVGELVTLNDALISALIVTIGRWNAGHGRRQRLVRVSVPVNTRAAGQPVAIGNLSRLVTIAARPPAAEAGFPALLADVAGQVRRARDRPGPQVDGGSRALARLWFPAAVKRRLVRLALRTVGPLVCDTMMLTNLGNAPDPPDFGQQEPVTLALSGPAHMPRGLSVAVATSGRQPLVALRYNRALLDEPAATRFLASYVEAIGAFTAPGPPHLQPSEPINPDWSAPASASTVATD